MWSDWLNSVIAPISGSTIILKILKFIEYHPIFLSLMKLIFTVSDHIIGHLLQNDVTMTVSMSYVSNGPTKLWDIKHMSLKCYWPFHKYSVHVLCVQ